MSSEATDADDRPDANCILNNLEQQFHQLMLESKYNELTVKTTQENLNISLKRNIVLEHELETERLNNTMIKMELDSLVTLMDKSKNSSNNSEHDMKVLLKNCQHLSNQIYKLQTENMELKHALAKSNGQVSTTLGNQYKYKEKINSFTSTMNSLQIQIKKLDEESNITVQLIYNCKILVRKMLSALEYSKKLNETQFDNTQNIIKEVANIKSKIDMFVNQNQKQQIMKTDQENTSKKNPSNQIHLDICMKLVGTLETENYSLHRSLQQILEKQKSENNIDKFPK